MKPSGRALVVSVLGLLFLAEGSAVAADKGADDAGGGTTPAAPPAPAPATTDSAGSGPGKVSNIEDASLEGLLDLNLEDRMGKTEAVSRTSESILRAPAAITTVDSTQIRLSGATTVPDVLRSIPGVVVVRNAPGNYVVSLRGTGGLAGNNVILLVDGIPLNNPLDGTVSWDLIPVNLEDIERIEVVRGPVSPTYGANAYTGVINIVTRTTVGLTPSYVARLRAGTDGNGGTLGSVSGRFVHIAKSVQFKAFLRGEHISTSAKSDSRADAPPMNALAGMAELKLLPSKNSQLALEGGYVFSRRSGMDHLSLDAGSQTQRMSFARALYELHPASPLSTVRLWAQGISFQTDADNDQATGFSYDGSRALRTALGTDLVLTLSPALSVTAGGQGSIERIDAIFVNPSASGRARSSYGFYAGVKAQPLSSLDFVLTGRGDLSPISAKVEYSYRASAIYHADTWGLRLTGASAFRSPTYIEAAGRFVDRQSGLILLEGTDSIGAPGNTSVELGATFAPIESLTMSGTVYYSRLSNLMVEAFDSVVRRTFENDANARNLLGAEFEGLWRVTEFLSVMPSFSVLKWLDSSENGDTNVGVPEQNPRYLAGLRLQGVFGGDTWGYGIRGTFASARSYNVRSGIPPQVLGAELPAATRLSAMLEHQLVPSPSIWASVRLSATLPNKSLESPLPFATPLGQSIVLGVEVRRE